MTKVCILVGEGTSERYFFPSLLISSFNFVELQDKQGYILFNQELNVYWFFLPPMVCKRTGKSKLYSHETYRIADDTVENHAHLMSDTKLSKYYAILHDADINDPRHLSRCEKSVKTAFKKSGIVVKNVDIHFVHIEIESWFIAGLDVAFPYFDKKKNKEVKRLLSMNPDDILLPKEKLDNVLSADLKSAVKKIATECGKYLDIKRAQKKSPSFSNFISKLMQKGLL